LILRHVKLAGEHYPMIDPIPSTPIKFRVEQQGLTRRDLEEIVGTPPTSYELNTWQPLVRT
jgi:hypothetical protein